MEMLDSDKCEHHKEEELKLHCIDCKHNICSSCYIESHQTHNWSDIKFASHGHRKELFENIGVLSTCSETVRRMRRKLEENPREIAAKIGSLKTEVEKRRLELKRLVDNHTVVLIKKLDSLSETQLKAIGKVIEDIDRHNKCLESLKYYVNEFADKATAADICQAIDSIRERTIELKETNYSIIESQLSPLDVSFWKTDFQEFLSSDRCNILGIIQEKCVTSKETTIGRNAEETKELQIKVEQPKHETETEKLIYQKYLGKLNAMKQDLDRERANKNRLVMKERKLSETVQQLEQEVAHLNRMTAKVQKQLEDERKKMQTLDSEIKKCLQKEREFLQEKSSFASKEKHLNKIIEQLTRQEKEAIQAMNKFKQETASQRTLCDSLQAEQQALHTQAEQKELLALMEHDKDTTKIEELLEKLIESSNERQKFKKRQTELEKLLYKGRPKEIDYNDVQASVQQIESNPWVQKVTITGLTMIDGMMYVAKEHDNSIEGYDSITFKFISRDSVKGLLDPRDIKGTKRDCLYIFDLMCNYQPYEILIFDLNMKEIKKRWSTEDNNGSLSVTHEGNAILTVHNKNKLMEFTSDGQLLREITLSSTISNPLHSLKLTSGHLVVSYGPANENGEVSPNRGICIVDENGEILKSFGEENESWLKELSHPVCLAVDSNGSIMVADKTNGRVLILSSALEFKGTVVSRNHGLKRPMIIHLDELNGTRLLVADDELNYEIHVFKFGELQWKDSGFVELIKFLPISVKKGFLLLLIICLFCLIGTNSGQIFNFILLAIFLIVFSRIAVP